MRWWGQHWGASFCDSSPPGAVPAGRPCAHCAEPIEAVDSGVSMGFLAVSKSGERTPTEVHFHLDCHLRSVVGSLAHQERRCRCYGEDSGDGELAPGMTARQEATAAVDHFYAANGAPRGG